MIRSKKITVPLFNEDFRVICVSDSEWLKAIDKYELRNSLCGDDLLDSSTFSALAIEKDLPSGGKEFIMILKPEGTVGEIVHESKHIVNYIFKKIGLKLDLKNDETEAYVLEYVFEKTELFFRKCVEQDMMELVEPKPKKKK